MPKQFKQEDYGLPEYLFNQVIEKCKEARLKEEQVEEVLKRVEREYENAQINPGEGIGVVVAESFGEPGTQMSIHKDEKIVIKINNKVKNVKIGEFVDSLMELKGALKLDNHSEILPLNDLEFFVPSLNHEERIEWKKVSECSRHKPVRNLIKLRTASGRQIIATDNHSFVTRKNNSIVKIKGSDLKLNDRIPVINSFNTEAQKTLDIADFLEKDYACEDEKGFLETKHNAKPIPRLIELNKDTGWFIGAYLAEGNALVGSISISNLNDDYINNAKAFFNNMNLDYTEDFHHRGFAFSRDLKANSTLLSQFIISSCGSGSKLKRVPDFAYNASNEFVSGLLRGYFDGDGNFHVDRDMIRVSSNSKQLTDGIALLLSRFKIFSYKIRDKKGQYWLLIPYKYAPLYLANINSGIEYKRRDLELLAERARKFWNEKSQDYTDMISGFGTILADVSRKLGLMTRYVNSATKRQRIGRTALFRHIKNFEKISKEKNIDIAEELEILNRMFNSDVIWDEIVEIEEVNSANEYVYDLSVPGLETFTTFDGIITHNTLNVFHFAGVAEMAVTLGLPRLIEIFDARKTPSSPRMTVYLKRGYARDITEVRKIAAQIKETKLGHIVTEFSINLSKLRIELALNKAVMRDLRITEAQLVKTLQESLKNTEVKEYKEYITLTPEMKENNISELYQLKEKSKDLHIKGIKGVKQVLPIKQDTEFVVICSGTNLKDVLKIEGVDETRTTTNDLFEVLSVLGIEAARNVIISEAADVIKNQGLDIDMRHIVFLADVMTMSGNIKGITRSGITSEKESVLARAIFETPIKHIVNASLVGEVDQLNSVIENVILNQPVPIGTGLPDLVAKMKKKE